MGGLTSQLSAGQEVAVSQLQQTVHLSCIRQRGGIWRLGLALYWAHKRVTLKSCPSPVGKGLLCRKLFPGT